jgi:hypothetical protein
MTLCKVLQYSLTDIKTLCVREEFEKRYREKSPYA